MKKFVFCCFVVLLGSCKDKAEEVKPDADFAVEFIGNYTTNTPDGTLETEHLWEVTATGKNQLAILYTRNVSGTVAGVKITGFQKYTLVKVVSTALDTFTINEEVSVEQTGGTALRQKVLGVGAKVKNASGVQQINITLKVTNTATGVATEQYLEFKKK